jgi:hypothetical protein
MEMLGAAAAGGAIHAGSHWITGWIVPTFQSRYDLEIYFWKSTVKVTQWI